MEARSSIAALQKGVVLVLGSLLLFGCDRPADQLVSAGDGVAQNQETDDPLLWASARSGMNPDRVREAVPGTTEVTHPLEDSSGTGLLVARNTRVSRWKGDVTFYFKLGELSKVVAEIHSERPPSQTTVDDFMGLKAALSGKYGQPVHCEADAELADVCRYESGGVDVRLVAAHYFGKPYGVISIVYLPSTI